MSGALQTAVLGMTAYQEMLNVTGNNIANADTIAYKEDRILFSDMFSRTLSSGVQASEDIGGTNPVQIGMGVRVSAVDKNMAQGSFSSSEEPFDLAIDGEGYFVCDDGIGFVYTRAGTFDVDAEGYLVDPSTGYRVQRIGITGEDNGFQIAGDNGIQIPYRTELPGSPTQIIEFKGNLSADQLTETTTRMQSSGDTFTLVGGGLADATSQFANVDQLQGFAAGETITITGREHDGTAVSGTFTYGPANDGTTIQDLLDSVETAFGGPAACTASMSEGYITVEDAVSGYSLMDVHLSSAAWPDSMPADFNYSEVGGAASQTTNIAIYDRQGRSQSLTMTFVRQAEGQNVWDVVVNQCTGASAVTDRRIAGVAFDENGIYQGVTGADGFGNDATMPGFVEWDNDFSFTFPGITSVQDVTCQFGREQYYDGLTQVGGDSTAGAIDQDGYGTGALENVTVGAGGMISGTFSNGVTLDIASIRIAVFDNPEGLERIGGNYFRHTPSAGAIVYTEGLQSRAGQIRQYVLENSNVDLASEFTQLIIAQRGYQVNSRTVRVANNMLQQLVSVIT